MPKGFSTLDNPNHEGQTDTWLTPLSLVESLGKFDFDPCGYPGHNTAKNMICLPDDGLLAEWQGRVWLNPPYGRNIGKWLNKLERYNDGIALVFARTDTKWFQNLKPDAIFFIKGRIAFLKPDKTINTNAGHGSMLIIYGVNNVMSVVYSKLEGKMVYQKPYFRNPIGDKNESNR